MKDYAKLQTLMPKKEGGEGTERKPKKRKKEVISELDYCIQKQPILPCSSSYPCCFKQKKLTDLDMTANSSARLCLEFCKEKSRKVPF